MKGDKERTYLNQAHAINGGLKALLHHGAFLKTIKVFIGLVFFYLVFVKVFNYDVQQALQVLLIQLQDVESLMLLIFIVMLVPVNWGIEAVKWQLAMRKFHIFSIQEAYAMVLTGLGVGTVIPGTIGDFMGRASHIDSSEVRHQSIAPLLLNGVSQVIPSLFFGSMAIVFLLKIMDATLIGLFVGTSVVCGSILFIQIYGKRSFRFLLKYVPAVVKKSLDAFFTVSNHDLWKLIFYSFIRYAVFFLQFYIMFRLLHVTLESWHLSLGIFWIFLVKTIVPRLTFFADLAIRSASGVFFFNLFGVETSLVISATLLIWLINVLIPGAIGSLLVARTKLF